MKWYNNFCILSSVFVVYAVLCVKFETTAISERPVIRAFIPVELDAHKWVFVPHRPPVQVFLFTGVYSPEKGHQENVCNEVHEQSHVCGEGSCEKCDEGGGALNEARPSIPRQPLVYFSGGQV